MVFTDQKNLSVFAAEALKIGEDGLIKAGLDASIFFGSGESKIDETKQNNSVCCQWYSKVCTGSFRRYISNFFPNQAGKLVVIT